MAHRQTDTSIKCWPWEALLKVFKCTNRRLNFQLLVVYSANRSTEVVQGRLDYLEETNVIPLPQIKALKHY